MRTWIIFLLLAGLAGTGRGQDAVLTSGTPGQEVRFGHTVSLSDGLALVGAPDDPVAGEAGEIGPGTGVAYLFERTDDGWRQMVKFQAPAPTAGDQFGTAVALNGTFALVGAPGDDREGFDAGAVYVFRKDEQEGWMPFQTLTAGDPGPGDRFGTAVAISVSFALVGAPGEDDGGFDSGAAYAYSYSHNTGWTQRSKLQDFLEAPGDAFGSAVAMLDAVALIGAPGADDPRGQDAGLAHVYRRGSLTWAQSATLTAGDAFIGYAFGTSVALLDDPFQTFAFIGSPGNDNQGTDAGAAYVFADFDSLWAQQVRLIPDGTTDGDRFGASAAAFGAHVAIGAPGVDQAGAGRGSVYLFRKQTIDLWPHQATIYPKGHGVAFGAAVGMHERGLLVGAPGPRGALHRDGAVYLYEDAPALMTASEPPEGRPGLSLALGHFPNPSSATTTIAFTLPAPGPTRLAVYDLLGREVEVLVSETLAPGRHQYRWDAAPFARGVYLYRLRHAGVTIARPVVIVDP